MSKSTKWYDWDRTFSYDADVTMVVGARGIGKTYGLRKQFIRDYIKDHSRFVEITRFKTELSDITKGYFDRVARDYPDFIFKTDTRFAYIAPRPLSPTDKPIWDLLGYFVSLTEAQKAKKRTFEFVHRLAMDEAILDTHDRWHHYLPKEFESLANIVDSCTRERADVSGIPPKVYLLGNACDLINPYFDRFGIDTEPSYGYTRYGIFLLHMVKDDAYAEAKRENTLSGRMLKGSLEETITAFNDFKATAHLDFIEKKSARAKYFCAYIWEGVTFAVWIDWSTGTHYINGRIPKDGSNIFALTTRDHRLNRLLVSRSSSNMKAIAEMTRYNALRFDTVARREKFYKAMKLFGLQ